MFTLIKEEYATNKIYMIRIIVFSIIKGIGNFLLTLIPGLIANAILFSEQSILKLILILLVAQFLLYFCNPVINYLIGQKSNLQQKSKYDYLLNSLKNNDMQLIESTEYQDRLSLARDYIDKNSKVLTLIAGTVTNFFMIISIIIFIFYNSPLIFLIYILLGCVSLITKLKQLKSTENIWARYMSNAREHNLLNRIMIDREHAHERVLFNTFSYLKPIFIEKFKIAFIENKKDGSKRLFYDVIFELASIIVSFACLCIWIFVYYNNDITLGMLLVLFGFTLSFNTIISDELSKKSEYVNIISGYKAYKDICFNKTINKNLNKFNYNGSYEIYFDNVWFKYPNNDDYSIKGFTYTFNLNKNYVILGPNGSGKSTLIKLMLGLYKPNKGVVMINGKNISDFDDEVKNKIFSVLFQQPNKYPLTIEDNIRIGNVDQSINIQKNIEKIDPLLIEAINKFELGILSNLSVHGDKPVNLSGGEWQKLFFARVHSNPANVFILDEPTSNLDPLAEMEFYDSIDNLMKAKMNIFISHRLGIVKYADELIVINNGQLVEQGSHKELYGKGGLYYEMYKSQQSLYKIELSSNS